ncbi:hypothetical protein ACJJTC_002196 [Scirpophaga incertulas]
MIVKQKLSGIPGKSPGCLDLRKELEEANSRPGSSPSPVETTIHNEEMEHSGCQVQEEKEKEWLLEDWEKEEKPQTPRPEAHDETFRKKYPHLPGVRCPRSLFISIIGPGFLNSLYITNYDIFPKNWDSLRSEDPVQAWRSLNQKIIPFINDRWSHQGIDIKGSDTAVDCYNITA